MSHVMLSPAVLQGFLTLPPSKSAAHRAIVCAALSGGTCILHNIDLSNDIAATIRAVSALGVKTQWQGTTLTIDSRALFSCSKAEIDCGESGSTLRFIIPIAAAGGVTAVFTGEGRLPQRPIGVYLDCLPKAGVACQTRGGLPLTVSGTLQAGVFTLPGNSSSQFITGLLLALPILNGDSEIVLTSPLESSGYVDMTIDIMAQFGVTVQKTPRGYYVCGKQQYTPCEYTAEGDWSQAAFFLSAAACSPSGSTNPIILKGLRPDSVQGDKAAAAIFSQFGASVAWKGDELTVSRHALHGIDIDASQIPDLVPILAVTAAVAHGTTRITGAARLRIKESDRLTAVAQGLTALGGKITELPDGLVIEGVDRLHGGKVDGCNDHRIVMAFSIAALTADGTVEITDAHSINKSYPAFFKEYNKLGGHANVINMG